MTAPDGEVNVDPIMTHGYRQDLAYIHDVGFGHVARSAAPVVLKLLRQNGKTGGLVVNLGCGSGILARELCDAGYRVLGFDISPAMIEIARRHAPGADFRLGSFLTAKLPCCVAVTAVGEILNYLFDRENTARRQAGSSAGSMILSMPAGFSSLMWLRRAASQAADLKEPIAKTETGRCLLKPRRTRNAGS